MGERKEREIKGREIEKKIHANWNRRKVIKSDKER